MKTIWVGCAPDLIDGYASHNHTHWEISLDLDGFGKSEVGDKTYDFSSGAIMCIPPYVYHSKTPVNKYRGACIFVQSPPFPIKDKVTVFTDDDEKTIETLMLVAHRIFCRKNKNYEAIVDAITTSICQTLLSWHSGKPQNKSVELFKQTLGENFTNPLFNASDAIESTGYCVDYFRICFKKDTGLTPVAYLNNLRIEHSKILLAEKYFTKMSISEIAFQSGFYDQHYFSRVFKKIVGITPQDYALLHMNP